MMKIESEKESFTLTDEFIEDFDFAYETLKTYYPYFDINKEVNNIDWLGNRDRYRHKISKCKTDEEFYGTMNNILFELHNGHTHLLPIEMGLDMYIYYKNLQEPNWRLDMANIFKKSRVKVRYKVTNENINKISEAEANHEPNETIHKNVIVGYVISRKIGYIGVKQMVHPDLKIESFKTESEIVKNYLETIKDYPILIIDIRGNDGGNSKYWSDFLMPLIVDKTYSQKTYRFLKEGDIFSNVKVDEGYIEYTNGFKLDLNFPEKTFNMINDFSYFASHVAKVKAHKDSINFKGEIFLLVDKKVYSSSEVMASFAKDSKMATLVGERTRGDGIGSDPMLIDLPNSGYVLRFAKEMGITEKGSINELDQTQPDIVVQNPIKKIEFDSDGQVILNNDKAIMAIIEK